ncbi:MAG: PD-(D/E)XK nuclease family protein [Thermoplasmata archaeon]
MPRLRKDSTTKDRKNRKKGRRYYSQKTKKLSCPTVKRQRAKVLPPQYIAFKEIRNQIASADTKYRFGQKFIKVSWIANQFYCEKQLDFKMRDTPLLSQKAKDIADEQDAKMKIGSEGHDADSIFFQKVTEEKVWIDAFRADRAEPYRLKEFFELCYHNGVPIAGQIDEVELRNGKILTLWEFKFRGTMRLYDNDKIQAQVYTYVLQNMGFDISEMKIRLECFPPEKKQIALIARRFLHRIPIKMNAVVEELRYDPEKTKQNLDWALQYWKSEREAVPTSHTGKCKSCKYLENCNESPLKKKPQTAQTKLLV